MQLELLNDQGQAASKVDAPETVFGREYNEALVHQIVVAYQANARQGTRAQKDREQVKHSTKKPFRQKGTGRARAGHGDTRQHGAAGVLHVAGHADRGDGREGIQEGGLGVGHQQHVGLVRDGKEIVDLANCGGQPPFDATDMVALIAAGGIGLYLVWGLVSRFVDHEGNSSVAEVTGAPSPRP